MKNNLLRLIVLGLMGLALARGNESQQNTVILDETAVQNLKLETGLAEERSFETTVFAIGRIEEIPARRYSVSSRIAGRAVAVNAFAGDHVKRGDVLVTVESRQPGNPPPTISIEALTDGLVVTSHVLKGQPVDPDQDLLDIADRSVLWAVAKIPEQDIQQIRPGARARIVVHALSEEPIEARMIRYGVSADVSSGTVDGVFEIENSDGRLLPGMRAEFSIIISTRESVLSVPREAVQGDPVSRVVYVRDFDLPNAFIRSPVVLGEQNDRFVEVLSGLFPGDEVVTQGSYMLGYVSSASGISLKEALDAAHGHEHNEDGSEMTPEQKAAAKSKHHDSHDHGNHGNPVLVVYAMAVTLLAVWLYITRSNPAKLKV